MKQVSRSFFVFVLLTLVSTVAFAQLTASLTGNVTTGGTGLPGVTVTISSPQMQGTRTTVTGDGGGYSFSGIPPGDYTVRFELEGLQTATRRVQVGVGQSGRADADLRVAAVAEAITVTAATPSVLETPTVTTNISARTVEELPIPRTVLATALLAPGVNDNTASGSQLSISGSPGYDNLVLVNGVAITEAVRSQALSLFIEDAIQETTVMTGAISAEYGRFTGGVVNSITKSGGNEFSGSLRDSLTNPSWEDETAGQKDRGLTNSDVLNQVWEATLGGFILRDRLWFFLAGRDTESSNDAVTRPVPGDPTVFSFVQGDQETRLEGKLTGQITSRHNLAASYFESDRVRTNSRFTATSYDLEQLSDRTDPQELLSAFYNGVITNNLMLEARYSAMDWGVGWGSGSKFTDVIRGTIVRNRADGSARFNSATFCGVCDKETRSNDSWLAKANYFLSTRSMGNHNVVAGTESFSEHRFANNYQSGSNYRVFVNSVQRIGDKLYPNVRPGRSGSGSYFQWTPIFSLQQNESDLKTNSFFVNDRWDLNQNWSFSLGVRYDKNDAIDASGNKASDDSKFSPRLNATFDPTGSGRHRFTASYGEYASRIVEGPGTASASGGSPASIFFAYLGPELNPAGTPADQLLDTHQVLQRMFDWFFSQCNAQGQCGPENLSLLRNTAQFVPGYDTRIADTLASPFVREVTLGYGTQLFSNAVARVDLVARDWYDFYGFRVDRSTPQEADFLGIEHDVALVENTNEIERTYRGVQFQANWRPRRFNIGLNYTWSTLRGNDSQEDANSGTVGNIIASGWYPETYFDENQPVGYLFQDQRHRARAWFGWDVPLPRVVGALNISVLQNFDSGLPYSVVGTADISPYLEARLGDATYVTPPEGRTYFFSDRGEFRLDDVSSTNLALNYRFPISRFEIFAQGEALNVFNDQTVTAINTSVSTAWTSSNFVPFNPFTGETLIECPQGTAGSECKAMGAHWQKGSNFGSPSSATAYQTPRTYRVSLGLRF